VRGVVPETHREARILVGCILRKPATAETLERLAFRQDVLTVGTLEVLPRARPKLPPRNSDDHGYLLSRLRYSLSPPPQSPIRRREARAGGAARGRPVADDVRGESKRCANEPRRHGHQPFAPRA